MEMTRNGSMVRLMQRAAMLTLIAIMFLLCAKNAKAEPVTFTVGPQADAYILSGILADTNWGHPYLGFSEFAVGKQNAFTGGPANNQVGRQLYQFSLPTYITELPIISATLQLTVFDNYAGVPCNTAVYGLSDAWAEMTVTWNTQPVVDSSEIDIVLITNPPRPWGETFDYDVTPYVKAQVLDGDFLISFQQRGQDETVVEGVRWWQREGGDWVVVGDVRGKEPALSIVAQRVPEPATLFLLATGLVGLGGVAWRRHRRG